MAVEIANDHIGVVIIQESGLSNWNCLVGGL